MNILQLQDVSHHYFSKSGYTKALDNISFSLKQSEFVSLLGPSGCGKSTILSIIGRLLNHTAGEIYVNKEKLVDSNTEIGYMLQQDYLFPWKTILDNVCLAPKIQKKENLHSIKRAKKLLEEVGLNDIANSYPTSLSGGMRQRAALVRTLMNDPDIFLLDEPFSALDYQTKLNLEELVSSILTQYKKTTILVTHDIAEAIAMSDRIIMMSANPGKIDKIYQIPIELRHASPMIARKHPKFDLLFDKIWNDLENKQNESGGWMFYGEKKQMNIYITSI